MRSLDGNQFSANWPAANFYRIKAMGLFKPDFYRSFAIGFALGAVVVFATVGSTGSMFTGSVVTPAIAATAE